MIEREKLKREIYALDQVIKSNGATLASRAMDEADREALLRQMNTRLSHRKLLQDRLDRLSR